jgi:hypothetical protein
MIHTHCFYFALFICLHAIPFVFTLHTVNLHHILLQLIKSVPLSLLQFSVFQCTCLPSPLAAKDETSAECKKLTTLTTQFLYSNISIFILFGTQKFFIERSVWFSDFLEANKETWRYGSPLNAMKFTGRPSFNVSLMVIVCVSSLVAVVCFMLKWITTSWW